MQHLSRALLSLALSAAFLFVFLPVGLLVRRLSDPMRLRRGERLVSYLNMARTPGPAAPHAGDARGLPARTS